MAETKPRAHKMQHAESPTWCVRCGTFDCCATGPCEGDDRNLFDSSTPDGFERMAADLFGAPPAR